MTSPTWPLGRTARVGRAGGVLIAALAIVATTHLVGVPGDPATRGEPRSRDAVRAVAPPVNLTAEADWTLELLGERIELWAGKARANDGDYISATNLGTLRLARARLTGSGEDYAAARAAADHALRADPGYVPARLLDVSVRFVLHDFRGALAAAEAVLADHPDLADALAAVGDAQLELGRLDAAEASYRELATVADGPPVLLRQARLAFLRGRPADALQLAARAREEARASASADLGVYEVAHGELARLAGEPAMAREAFGAALTRRPNDLGALLGLARLDAFDGDLAGATARLELASRIAPQPDTLALLAEVRMRAGDEAGAADAQATLDLVRELAGPAAAAYDRAHLRHELGHGDPDEATLAAALRSRDERPDAGGHDLAAWALYRLGRFAEARDAIAPALATGIRDARILFHAGAIDLALGRRADGERSLRAALALGPALDPLERVEAQRLLEG